MSLKDVLPPLTGRSYDQLAISDGGTASQEFLRMAFGETPPKEQQSIRRNLEQYCGQDTENMIRIIKALERMCA